MLRVGYKHLYNNLGAWTSVLVGPAIGLKGFGD